MDAPSAGNGGAAAMPASSSLQFPGVHSAPAEPPSSSTSKSPADAYAILGPPLAQVMTDEQLETLRRQISVYATICQQLVEMHKVIMAQQNAMSGLRFGQSSSCDSGLHSLGQRFASRQRWTPSQTQLQILEKLFQQGNGTPSKQRIKEISVELSQYGPISETNVYNWFQNRRARTKRKQQVGGSNTVESELDIDVDSQEEKRARTVKELPIDSNQQKPCLQKWEQVELKSPEIAQNGLQCFQRQAAVKNLASSYSKADGTGASATMLDMKPDPVGAPIVLHNPHVEGTDGNNDVTSLPI